MQLKRLYYDMRLGQSMVFPLIAAINFVIISYTLLELDRVIPIHVYIPLIATGLLFGLVITGNKLRKRQLSTDTGLVYEQSKDHAECMLCILYALQRSYIPADPQYKSLQYQIDKHEKIVNNTQS